MNDLSTTTYGYTFVVPEESTLKMTVHNRRYLDHTPHVRMFTDGLMILAMNPGFQKTDFRILMFILANMEFENIFGISQTEVGKQMGMSSQQVSMSMKRLVNLNCLKILGKQNAVNIYFVNPKLGFRSRARNLNQLVTAFEDDEPIRTSIQIAS